MSNVIQKKPNYQLIGFFMFIGIIGVMISVIFANKLVQRMRGGYPLYITFDDIDGLIPGSKVTVGGGKNIGQVDSIEMEGAKVIVKILIDRKYKINQDVQFRIFSTSVVGGKFLAVEHYTGLVPHIAKNSTLKGITPLSVNKIFDMLGGIFSSSSEEGVTAGMNTMFSSLTATISVIHKIIYDNKNNIDDTIKNLAQISKTLNSMTANLDKKLNMVNDEEFKKMVVNIQRSLYNVDIFLKDINSENAPLFLLKDPNMTHSLRTIVTNIQEATQRIKAKPSLLFKG